MEINTSARVDRHKCRGPFLPKKMDKALYFKTLANFVEGKNSGKISKPKQVMKWVVWGGA